MRDSKFLSVFLFSELFICCTPSTYGALLCQHIIVVVQMKTVLTEYCTLYTRGDDLQHRERERCWERGRCWGGGCWGGDVGGEGGYN